MARKPHKPPHVKTVKRNGKEYLYFNTGQRRANGNPIYTPLSITPHGSIAAI